MCMLTYYPPNALADTEALANGATFNKDGHGYAIVVPGKTPRLIVRHGLDALETIERFAHDRERHPFGPALFHSRFGTSGVQGKYNCHPFYVGHDRQTVVAHNGVLPPTMQPKNGDRRCDTRMAADEIFAHNYGHLSGKKARKRLGKAIGPGNKLVILTVNPDYPQWSYVINEPSGTWDMTNGIWYSNRDFQGWDWQKWDDDDDAEKLEAFGELDCTECKALDSIDPATAVCQYCYSCADCGEYAYEDCLCWTGETMAAALNDEANEWWTKDDDERWAL